MRKNEKNKNKNSNKQFYAHALAFYPPNLIMINGFKANFIDFKEFFI